MRETTIIGKTSTKDNIEYGKFWIRTGAYVVDSIVLLIVTIPIGYYNVTSFKSLRL